MPVLILLIILDLAIVGWVLWVGIRDNAQLAASAHGVPEKDSPQVERGEVAVPPTAPPAPAIDTRFIRQGALPDTEEMRLEDIDAARGVSTSDSVVSIRPSRRDEPIQPVEPNEDTVEDKPGNNA